MINIRLALPNDAATLSELAQITWHDHYPSIITLEQIDYMLERFHSKEVLKEQIEQSVQFYYLVFDDETPIGFFSWTREANELAKLQKLYLLKNVQGKGWGKLILDYIRKLLKEKGFNNLQLNVNRGNPTYHWYLKQGFVVVQEVDIPMDRFVLNDYVMNLSL